MALRSPSMFLYGYKVNELNSSLDFRATNAGPILLATLQFGYYSLSSLMEEIKRAMQAADPDNEYTVTADRTVAGGTQNRMTISTSGSYLDLLYGTGPRVVTSIAFLTGFPNADQTGFLSYTGTTTTGTTMTTTLTGYSYLGPQYNQKVFGNVNISASGLKEAIVFAIQQFIEVQYKYEPATKVENEWLPLNQWMIQQRPLEITPEITNPQTFYQITLETSSADGKGLGFRLTEMLPHHPFLYQTGMMKFRVRVE